ncbi:MAG: arginyltransferase [Burkholderiaceae bacterium]|nr:arginyltransferase [Burkholderiaceae bacterium]
MTYLKELPLAALQFYTTSPYPCSYLPGQTARSQVATPHHLINSDVYGHLVRAGFRRSGAFTYRPMCDGCRACVPLRVDVAGFNPNRNQRRCWKAGQALSSRISRLGFSAEHYDLYLRYQSVRHPGAGMDHDNREQYAQFMLQSKVNTRIAEFRDPDGKLAIVSVIDILEDGLSSVYTFFDPQDRSLSLGTYGVLWQIEQCRRLGLPHLYLGYWLEESRKMSYKSAFQPVEVLRSGRWQALTGVANRSAAADSEDAAGEVSGEVRAGNETP